MSNFVIPADKTLMIDVSHYRKVDYSLLPREVEIVIVKATEGTWYRDDRLEEHADGVLESGRVLGFFHFHRTLVGGKLIDPVSQAEFYIENTKQYGDDISIDAWDFENPFHYNGDPKRPYNPCVGNEQLALKKALTRLKDERDKFSLLYTSKGSWDHFKMVNITNGWGGPTWMRNGAEGLIDGVWEARYGGPPLGIKPFAKHWAHQFTDRMEIPGVFDGNDKPIGVDGNIVDYHPDDVIPMLRGFARPVKGPDDPDEGKDWFMKGFEAGRESERERILACINN